MTVDPKRRPLRHHRPARRPRPGHRRLQGRLAGRRRAARRAPGLLRDLLPRSRAGPDAARRRATPSASSCSKVRELHPDSPKPAIVGNCQGGWAAMMLAAVRPGRHRPDRDQRRADVLLGRRLAARARATTRCATPAACSAAPGSRRSRADLGAGMFDGAYLVRELREPEPGQHVLGQVLQPVRERRHRAAALPRVRALVGRLLPDEPRGDRVDHAATSSSATSCGRATVRRARRQVFDLRDDQGADRRCSRRWATTSRRRSRRSTGSPTSTASTEEIKARGQVIVGLLHEDVGHLGIFVSGKVAKKEHAQIVSVLKSIEALPPGLYGMQITRAQAARRRASSTRSSSSSARLEDIAQAAEPLRARRREALRGGGRAVRADRARLRAARAPDRAPDDARVAGQGLRELHPLRTQRWAISDHNPFVAALAPAAALARAWRQPRRDGNALLRPRAFRERGGVGLARPLPRPARRGGGRRVLPGLRQHAVARGRRPAERAIRRATRFDPRALPAVRQVLESIEDAGAIEGHVRIGLLVAKAGSGRRKLSSMERVRELMAPAHLLDGVSEDAFRSLMHEETIIVEFEPDRAKRALPAILRTPADRRHAHDLLDGIATHHRLDERQLALVAELRGPCRCAQGAAAPRARRGAPPPGTRRTPRRAARAARGAFRRQDDTMQDYGNRTFDEIEIGADRDRLAHAHRHRRRGARARGGRRRGAAHRGRRPRGAADRAGRRRDRDDRGAAQPPPAGAGYAASCCHALHYSGIINIGDTLTATVVAKAKHKRDHIDRVRLPLCEPGRRRCWSTAR
ncbi:MAG: DUF3141 domain-containing protein [Comamonadaceae bacterium]|nr:DUF3141 domain-containing protein [Comamonadaceae bacterium]